MYILPSIFYGFVSLERDFYFHLFSILSICTVFVWGFTYETKFFTLEQVEELYGMVSKAWQSKKFRAQDSFQNAKDIEDGKMEE